jgi:uncharacterized protein (DUF1330 family)
MGGRDEKLHAIALSLLCGVGIGAAGVEGLRAQAKPPIYMIGNNDVSDPDGYMKEYLPLAQASLKAHGAVYIAAGKGTAIDGEPPKGRVVIIRWDSMEQLLAWRHSPEYEAARKIGEKYAKYNVIAVEGAKP